MSEAPPPKDVVPAPADETAADEGEQPGSPSKTQADGPELSQDASAIQKFGFKILMSHSFERAMGAVIGINFVVVIVETDNNAMETTPPVWVWYAGWGLLTTFVVELVAKLFVLRSQFWHEKWNVFDFFVIAIDTTFSLLEVIGMSFLNVSMLRILRLSRLARATKVFRMFPELKLMMAGLAGAVNAIFWGSALLFVALLVWSVLAVQFINPLNKEIHEASDVYAGCDRCPRAFESTFQACLTFTTQIVAGDSWGRETQPIIEAFPVTAVFFLSVYVSVGLAIMNLILGVVVNVATEARDRLLKEEADEKLLMANESLSALLVMCQEMDDDGNDELTFDEIKEGFDSNEPFRNTLLDMDIGRDDLQIVWTILDSDKSGTVTSKEFVNQIYRMKNSDSQFMLAYIKFYITEIKDRLRGDLLHLGQKIDADFREIEVEIDDGMDKLDKVQNQVAGVAGSAQLIQDEVQNIQTNTANTQMQVEANRRQIVANTGKINAEYGAGADMGFDRYGARPQNLYESAEFEGRSQQGMPSGHTEYGQLAEVGRPAFTADKELTSLMFDSGSLKELLENVHFSERTVDSGTDKTLLNAPFVPRFKEVHDPAEILTRLETAWQQCIVSIDDMRNFHMSLADLLESIVRRVSITIHHTVTASVTTSTRKIPGMMRQAAQLSRAAESLLRATNDPGLASSTAASC